MNLNGKKKSAILLALIGIEKATEILKELSFEEIESIVIHMSNMSFISDDIANQVLSEFTDLFHKNAKKCENVISKNFILSLLKKSLGENDANVLLNKIQDKKNIFNSIKKLQGIDSLKIVDAIKNEHPQIIATILLYLNRNKAADILSFLEDKLSLDIVKRIAKFSGLKKIGEIEFIEIINNLLDICQGSVFNKKGIITVVELLKLIKKDKEEKLLNDLIISDKKLAQKIKTEMFEISDIKNLDDKYIQRLVKMYPLDELFEIIKIEKDELKEKFYKNMSQENIDRMKNFCSRELSISHDMLQKKRNKLLNLIKNILYSS